MKQKIIQVKNLGKTYHSGEVETPAVSGASFEIKKGEFVAITGPSGSGKSTLMQMLGFLERPTVGEYLFKGKSAQKYSDDDLAKIRNKEAGFVFQSFNLLPGTTVFENVELPLLYDKRRINAQKRKLNVQKALKAVNLEHRLDYYSNQISGGEKQRVAIARALVNDPEIIFADEPTGNLDSKSGTQVMDILADLNKKGKTVILVTHDQELVKYARRIIEIMDRKVVSDYAKQA
ncbi:MAG: ABC transporter ATP-binding protein [Patescibacteria group bacterium]